MSRQKKNVLLVSPNELTLSVMVVKLKVWGFNVEGHFAIEEALPAIRKRPFDLVILMPHADTRTWNRFREVMLEMLEIQSNRHSEVRIYDPIRILQHEFTRGVLKLSVDHDQPDSMRIAIRLACDRRRGPKTGIPAEYRAMWGVA